MAAAAVAAAGLMSPTASAAPGSPQAAPPRTAPGAPAAPPELPTPGPPMPVIGSQVSYIATHAVTRRAREMKVSDGIASLPVPSEYRPANLALAQQFKTAVDAALTSRGGCVQVVVDPQARSGSLFDYGFFPIAGQYCS